MVDRATSGHAMNGMAKLHVPVAIDCMMNKERYRGS